MLYICYQSIHTKIVEVKFSAHIYKISGTVLFTWSDDKVCELATPPLLRYLLLSCTVVPVKIVPLGCYTQIPPFLPSFETFLELVFGLYSCHRIVLNVFNILKMHSIQVFFIIGNRKKLHRVRFGK